MASGGWIGSYSALPGCHKKQKKSGHRDSRVTYVASFPAYFRIILLPPVVINQSMHICVQERLYFTGVVCGGTVSPELVTLQCAHRPGSL